MIGRKRARHASWIASKRRQPALTFRLQREVDHHDRVLLHDAHQQDDADDAHDRQLDPGHQQRQQRAEPGRGQRRHDRQRMQSGFRTARPARCRSRSTPAPISSGCVASDCCSHCALPANSVRTSSGMRRSRVGLLHASIASPNALPGGRLKLMRRRGELALVAAPRVPRCRARTAPPPTAGPGCRCWRRHRAVKQRRIGLQRRIDLQHHLVLVALGIDGRDLPLGVGVVQCVVDRRRC